MNNNDIEDVEWYIPRRSSSKDTPEIRITEKYISISNYCIKNYFLSKKYARIAYDKSNDKLLIKPTDEGDAYGFKLVGDKDANFQYLNAKNFILKYGLAPKVKRSEKYECSWNKVKGWLEVENIIK